VLDLLGTAWSEHPDVDLRDRTCFEIAVTEVAGNIVQHTAAGSDVQFFLDVAVSGDRLTAMFTDDGPPADADVDAAELPDGLAESGRGLALARSAVDQVEYTRDVDGNHWLVVRRRS
jgi:serine/threonine-protein kinase RsbW